MTEPKNAKFASVIACSIN